MVSYKKLWHLLHDKDLKKKDLVTVAGVSSCIVNKLTRGDNATTEVLQKICKSLECDIMEIFPDEPKAKKSGRTIKR